MDAKLKEDWVKALRSGEYRQGVGKLHNPVDDSYCCLGVLCKIMGAEFKDATESDDDEFGSVSYDYVPVLGTRVLGRDEELKRSLCKELGISDQYHLISLNDGEKDECPQPFSVIADYIEREL